MKLQDFKKIKYSDIHALTIDKRTGEKFNIKLDYENGEMFISKENYEYILEDDYDNYEIIEDVDYNLATVYCDNCGEYEAIGIEKYRYRVLCSNCINVNNFIKLDENVYKFMSHDELKKIAHYHNVNEVYESSIEKGIFIFCNEHEYYVLDHKKIGSF